MDSIYEIGKQDFMQYEILRQTEKDKIKERRI